jgi:hypothetical protein
VIAGKGPEGDPTPTPSRAGAPPAPPWGPGQPLVEGACVALLIGARLAIDAWVLRAGFSHVSDDDFARTVIAEQFAHAPRLDPSGTSWLPLPFWAAGAAMAVLGRSLEAARTIAIAMGAAAVAAPYVAMRAVRVPRGAALAAGAIAVALPWNAWLGVATVPDGWTGALLAAGAIAMGQERARPWSAAAVGIAALSRYEAWPACAVFTLACAWPRRSHASRRPRGRDAACAVFALAGPLLWMAWNAHAHGSPFHFIARVTAFRRAIGAAQVPWGDKVLAYPLALATETPEVVVLGACGMAGLAWSHEMRRRWRWAGATALAVLAFLLAGDLGDGAPTHHPARALGSIWWIGVGMGVDALGVAAAALASPPARRAVFTAAGAATVAWTATLAPRWIHSPGSGESEQRHAQIARGLAMKEAGAVSAEITPCQFEHFALLAAWGQPERARVNPRSQKPVTPDCPEITAP